MRSRRKMRSRMQEDDKNEAEVKDEEAPAEVVPWEQGNVNVRWL